MAVAAAAGGAGRGGGCAPGAPSWARSCGSGRGTLAAAAGDEEEAAVLTAGEVQVAARHTLKADISWPEGARVAELRAVRLARQQGPGRRRRRRLAEPAAAVPARRIVGGTRSGPSDRSWRPRRRAGSPSGNIPGAARSATATSRPPVRPRSRSPCRMPDGTIVGATGRRCGAGHEPRRVGHRPLPDRRRRRPRARPPPRSGTRRRCWRTRRAHASPRGGRASRSSPACSPRSRTASRPPPTATRSRRRSTTPTTCRSGIISIPRSNITAMMRSSSSTSPTTRRAGGSTRRGPTCSRRSSITTRTCDSRPRSSGSISAARSIADLDREAIDRLPAEPRRVRAALSDELAAMQRGPPRRRAGPRGGRPAVRRAGLASAAHRGRAGSGCATSTAGLRRESGLDHERAVRALLARILVAPAFLYRAEPPPAGRPGIVPLTDWQLASRLSYFLWSSMPDEELRRGGRRGPVARAGRSSSRSGPPHAARPEGTRRLATEFFGQWLGFYRFDRFQGHRRRAVPRVHRPAPGGDVRGGRRVLRAHRPRGPARRRDRLRRLHVPEPAARRALRDRGRGSSRATQFARVDGMARAPSRGPAGPGRRAGGDVGAAADQRRQAGRLGAPARRRHAGPAAAGGRRLDPGRGQCWPTA